MNATKAIWKFELTPGNVVIPMPKGARIISTGNQNGKIVVWAIVDPTAEKVDRLILCLPTGAPIVPKIEVMPFLGTLQFDGGSFIIHVFDGGEHNG